MPSLRRAFSSPSVRVSPYSHPTALPSSRSHRPPQNYPHGGGYRRSSGSDVSSRKVLADIDWWRVADGQREQGQGGDEDEEDEEMERGVGEENSVSAEHADSEAPHRNVIPELHATDRGGESAGVEIERPSTPVASERRNPFGVRSPGYSPQADLFGQLASLESGPRTPRTPTRRTASESSVSSVESSPEVLRTPIERPSFAGMGFADYGPDIPLFHMRLASLSELPLSPKHVFAKQQGGLGDNDQILADPFMCHDDLFA